MLSFKYNLFVCLFYVFMTVKPAHSVEMFSGRECLEGSFEVAIEHQASLFGLINNRLKIVKNECITEVFFQRVFPRKWIIDVCRSPVHIKYDTHSGLSILKRAEHCEQVSDEYCGQLNTLLNILQDDGLIFAKGQKEDLDTDHGQVYCTFLLFKQYLEQGHTFSIHAKKEIDLMPKEKKHAQTKPLKKVKQKPIVKEKKSQQHKEKTDEPLVETNKGPKKAKEVEPEQEPPESEGSDDVGTGFF